MARRSLIANANHEYVILDENTGDFLQEVKNNIGNFVAEQTARNKNRLFRGSYGVSVNRNANEFVATSAETTNLNDAPQESTSYLRSISNTHILDVDGSEFDKSNIDAQLTELNHSTNNSALNARINSVLNENHLYSPDRRSVPKDGFQTNKEANEYVKFGVQENLGEYRPKKGQQLKKTVSIDDLRKAGLAVLLHSSGEVIVPNDPSEASVLATSTVVPGVARLGGKLPMSRFSVVEAYKKIDPSFTKPSSSEIYSGPNVVYSYGSPFNFAATLNSIPSSMGVAMLATIVYGLASSISLLAEIPALPDFLGTDRITSKRDLLGRSKETVNSSNSSFRVVNFIKTKNGYLKCVQKGLQVFFGLEDGFGNAFESFTSSHQFFGTILRSIIRSATELVVPGVNAIQNISDNNTVSVSDVDDLNPLRVVERINNSVLFKFVNVVARIGDVALKNQGYYELMDANGATSFFDLIDEKETNLQAINPSILHAKHKLTANGKLAWRQNSIKSMYILPPSLMSSAQRFGNDSQIHAYSGIGAESIESMAMDNIVVASEQNLDNNNRIKAEKVKELEEYLEQDYIPFYLQDLRTNEIISFHAFFETISDGYNVNWSVEDGYGRVDQVANYKSTERSIGVTFKLVALDNEDFDLMWVKVNKLVTLVYPQWSEGRKVSFGNNKFIQPFSQYPSASPIIRLRIGDVVKSNYSKFHMARLFGMSSNQNEFSLEDFTNQNSEDRNNTYARIRERIQSIRERQSTGKYSVGDACFVLARQEQYRLQGAALNPTTSTTQRGNRRNGRTGVSRTTGISTRSRTGVQINTKTKVIIVETPSIGVDSIDPTTEFVVRVENPQTGQEGNFLVPLSRLEPDLNEISNKARTQVLRKAQTTNTTTTTDDLNAFLSDERNPIFRAFASNAGQGLAGYIKSLKFDYTESMWNIESYNGRAPKMIRIDFEFSPIHDIAPGIDSNGFNRAPLYNVGNSMATLCNSDANDYARRFTRFQANGAKLTI